MKWPTPDKPIGHVAQIKRSPWVQLLAEVDDRYMWLGLSSPIEYGDCDCEAGCECEAETA